MAYPLPLIKVENGMLYVGGGVAPVPPPQPDGFFIPTGNIPMNMLAKDGKWLDGVSYKKLKAENFIGLESQGSKCISTGNYPSLILKDSGETVAYPEVPGWNYPDGSLVILFGGKSSRYFFVGGKVDSPLPERLAEWFLSHDTEPAWRLLRGRTSLPKKTLLNKAMKYGMDVASLTGGDFRDFMKGPSNINDLVETLVKRKLGKVRSILKKQLEPIGGEILRLKPFWQKHMPLVWVEFKITGEYENGAIRSVDPTRGAGALVYLNGDFYYGPWCERIYQKDFSDKILLLHDFPPKYTLQSWISGPLLATAMYTKDGKREKQGIIGKGPSMFYPKGVKILARGTAFSNQVDTMKVKVDMDLLKSNFMLLALKANRKTSEEMYREFSKSMSGIVKLTEIDGGETECRISYDSWYSRDGIGSYLKNSGKRYWLCISKVDVAEYTVDCMENNKINWGFGFDVENLPRSFDKGAHITYPVRNCSCIPCRKMRRGVMTSITNFMEFKSVHPNKVLEQINIGSVYTALL